MAAVRNPARLFVNTIVSEYDALCHPTKAKIADIFNPHLEMGLKESSLQRFSERFSNPHLDTRFGHLTKMTDVQLDAQVVTSYKKSAPTLSHLFALTGMLDIPSQDPAIQAARLRIIEALAQDHLRSKKDYALDPMALLMLSMGSYMAQMMRIPDPLPQFANGKSHFYSQIFLEAYCRSSVHTKIRIVAQLKNFQPQLDSLSFRCKRVVFKIEGMFNYIVANKDLKFRVTIAFAVGSYFLVYKVIAVAGIAFNSAAFTLMSSSVVSYMPALVVQISSEAYNGLVGVVVYATSTRVYGYIFNSGQLVQMVIIRFLPLTNWVFYPVKSVAGQVQAIFYERAFGPSARVQEAIAKSLESRNPKDAKKLLEEGMKAYQIWMYLVEQGPQRGLFKAAPTP